MSKIFVLRKNSLMSSADSTLKFGNDNEIVIPLVVINQLQAYNGKNEKKRIANAILKYLESLDITKLKGRGVKQVNGSLIRISAEKPTKKWNRNQLDGISDDDWECLQVCLAIMEKNPQRKVILVTKNTALRIKAKMIGIQAEDFRDDLFPTPSEQYTGRVKVQTSKKVIDDFLRSVPVIDENGETNSNYPVKKPIEISQIYHGEKVEWITNMFVEISAYDNPNQTALGRYDGKRVVQLNFDEMSFPYGIVPKNVGQRFLLEALLTSWEQAPIVIAKGGAGTGKTFCSLAYAIDKLEDFNTRILVATPSETVGNEKLGFLPGDMKDKISPYLGGIKDNLSLIINGKKPKKKEKDSMVENGEFYFEKGLIQVQPIGFLRGRTIVNSIFIIDETQNIDPGDIKSIVTRAAEGSKFIFLGDPTQVDNPKLNEQYNGLVYLSEKMKGQELCWQIALDENESVRGELSRIASKIL